MAQYHFHDCKEISIGEGLQSPLEFSAFKIDPFKLQRVLKSMSGVDAIDDVLHSRRHRVSILQNHRPALSRQHTLSPSRNECSTYRQSNVATHRLRFRGNTTRSGFSRIALAPSWSNVARSSRNSRWTTNLRQCRRSFERTRVEHFRRPSSFFFPSPHSS